MKRNNVAYLSFVLAGIIVTFCYYHFFNAPEIAPVIDVTPQEKAAQQHQEQVTKHVQASRNYARRAKLIEEKINQRNKEATNEVFDIPTLHSKRDSIRAAEGFDLPDPK